MSAQAKWQRDSQESEVERIYTANAVNHDDIHQGYLNFGLWEPGITRYIDAAENMVSRLAQDIALRPGSQLLDVACGMGTQDVFLHQKFGPLTIDALDVTRVHVEEGRKRAAAAGLSRDVRFHHGTATELPFENASFTHVMSIEGPVHFKTRERFVQEAFRCLKPGGRLGMADYTLKRLPTNRLEKFVLDSTLSLWKIPVENSVNRFGYASMLKRSGFTQVSVKEVGEYTYPGYYFEQRNPAFRLHKIRTQGFYHGGLGFIIDIAAYRAYRMGLIDYALVKATKPQL
jgi:ubiquinone/menaquinone biosynthesis C-methylase UbiE